MSFPVALVIECNRCGAEWVRFTADADAPLDPQLLPTATGGLEAMAQAAPGVVHVTSPGGFYRSGGEWVRLGPGKSPMPPPGESYSEYWFTCPGRHPSSVLVRVDKFNAAATKALRAMHEARIPLARMSTDLLLRLVPR